MLIAEKESLNSQVVSSLRRFIKWAGFLQANKTSKKHLNLNLKQ